MDPNTQSTLPPRYYYVDNLKEFQLLESHVLPRHVSTDNSSLCVRVPFDQREAITGMFPINTADGKMISILTYGGEDCDCVNCHEKGSVTELAVDHTSKWLLVKVIDAIRLPEGSRPLSLSSGQTSDYHLGLPLRASDKAMFLDHLRRNPREQELVDSTSRDDWPAEARWLFDEADERA